ncbi:hypothetical protein FIBSPDRAFT_902055 [Athelia psychrophila]|uniref:KOW domain-containing protein n=1 Tax=Athelia psychrophila TaxID=1759441 RepID=A0A167XR30_9AGAM|nr:hypothetical protein FIBSPDRAFT_902055 [Fibularhizoctonia sp. CBS 109695]
MSKRTKFISLEAEVNDSGSEEEDDDDELRGKLYRLHFFDTADTPTDPSTPPLPRISAPSESPEDLERIAQEIKECYHGYREVQSSMNDQAFQVTVTPRYEKDIQDRLFALDKTFGICEVHQRSYFQGRLWIVTAQPEKLEKALYECNVVRRPRHIWPDEASPTEFLEWEPESLPKAGQWVRATRGLYKGDLALVLGDSPFTDILQIAVVPRIHSVPLPQNKKKHLEGRADADKKRKVPSGSSRPAPSIFDPVAAQMQRSAHAQTQKKGNNTGVQNIIQKLDRPIVPDGPDLTPIQHTLPDVTYIGGLLIKNVGGLGYELERSPLEHELVPFINSRVWPQIVLPQSVGLHWKEGDKVVIHAGDLASETTGTIASTDSTAGAQTALVRLDDDITGGCIIVDIATLHRRWQVGDGVKAVAGENLGKYGLVVQVEVDPPYIQFIDSDSLISIRAPSDYVESFAANTAVVQQQVHAFLVGERVKVVRGPLASRTGTLGIIQCLMDNNEVLILLKDSKDNKQEWVVLPFHFLEKSKDDIWDHEQLHRDAKSCLLNMQVFVTSGPDKGQLGEIREASVYENKFYVNLTFMTAQLPRWYLCGHLAIALENNAEGSRLDAKSDEELLREVRINQAHRRVIDLRTSIRASTPEMHDNLGTGQDVILGSFDVDPGENSRGLTSIGEVAIEMTDNKSRRTTDIIDIKHLLPAPPTKKDTDCIILEGQHRCELVKVLKINKKIGTATLVSWHSNSEKWDESLEHLCWVEMYK